MYCPICGQQQVAESIRFCSRCGFLLTGISAIVNNGGNLPAIQNRLPGKTLSARRRGIKQGLFIFLAACLLVAPVIGMLGEALKLPENLVRILIVIATMSGLLRMVYAIFFESNDAEIQPSHSSGGKSKQTAAFDFRANHENPALPPQAADFIQPNQFYDASRNNWRNPETGELIQPSVTENTTKLLERDEREGS